MSHMAELRKAAKLTQVAVSEALEVDRSTVAKWETGDSTPRPDKIPEIANIYGVNIEEAFKAAYGDGKE